MVPGSLGRLSDLSQACHSTDVWEESVQLASPQSGWVWADAEVTAGSALRATASSWGAASLEASASSVVSPSWAEASSAASPVAAWSSATASTASSVASASSPVSPCSCEATTAARSAAASTCAASALVGTSCVTMHKVSTMLRIRFFITFSQHNRTTVGASGSHGPACAQSAFLPHVILRDYRFQTRDNIRS